MEKGNYPNAIRVLDVILGLISMALGFWIILDLSLVPLTAIFLMVFALISLGIGRVAKGIVVQEMKPVSRVLNVIGGLFVMSLSIIVFAFASLAIQLLVLIVAFGVLGLGMIRFVIGIIESDLPGWGRGLHIIVGVLTMLLAIYSIVSQLIGFLTLSLVLAISFISNGFSRLVSGASGKVW